MDSPKETSLKENLQKRDKTLFLKFLHYLDSENLTADKNVQPGADPDYYLEELKKTRSVNLCKGSELKQQEGRKMGGLQNLRLCVKNVTTPGTCRFYHNLHLT